MPSVLVFPQNHHDSVALLLPLNNTYHHAAHAHAITLQTTPSLPLEAAPPLQASTSIENVAKPYPFSQLQPSKLGEFVFVSFVLLLLFWLGNYVVPDLIFWKVFHPDEDEDKNSMVNKDGILDSDVLGADRSESDLFSSSKATRSLETSEGALKDNTSKKKQSTGFGKARKQNGKVKKSKV